MTLLIRVNFFNIKEFVSNNLIILYMIVNYIKEKKKNDSTKLIYGVAARKEKINNNETMNI